MKRIYALSVAFLTLFGALSVPISADQCFVGEGEDPSVCIPCTSSRLQKRREYRAARRERKQLRRKRKKMLKKQWEEEEKPKYRKAYKAREKAAKKAWVEEQLEQEE